MSNDKKEFVEQVCSQQPAVAEATTALRFILTRNTDELNMIKQKTLLKEREHGFVILYDREDETLRNAILTGEQGAVNLTNYTLQDDEVPLLTVHTHWTSERSFDWERDVFGPAFPQDGDVMTHFERVEKLGPVFGVLAVGDNSKYAGDNKPPSLIIYTLGEDGAFTCAQAMHDAFTDGQHEMHYKKLMEGYTAWTITP